MPTLNQLSENLPNPGHLNDVSMVLDNQTLIISPGNITVIGSRPGMGRTLLLLYFYAHLLKNSKCNLYYLSNEENERILYRKLASTVTDIPLKMIQKNHDELLAAHPSLARDNCWIETNFDSWEAIKKEMEETIVMKKINVLFIDKIQGLYCEQSFRNRDQEISYIMKELKKMAGKYNMAIIISSSLNRSVESREGRIPFLADLRDSGALEDIADTVLFLHRPEYYGIMEDENGKNLKAYAELIIAKCRSGIPGKLRLLFNSSLPGFKPFSPQERYSFINAFNQLVDAFDLTTQADESPPLS